LPRINQVQDSREQSGASTVHWYPFAAKYRQWTISVLGLPLEWSKLAVTHSARSQYLPTLVLDADAAAAEIPAEQLGLYRLPAEVATSCWAAHSAVGRRHYGSLVIVADLHLPTDLSSITGLRARSLSSWIVVIGVTQQSPDAQRLVRRCGADALLFAPFSLTDLISLLLAFSLRPRPA
jgi:CheY-like chemotaxis protein